MTKLYITTRIITFFGTILRAFWEHLVCRICRIPVEDSRAFKSSELCGHVEHEIVGSLGQSFLMCWLPFTLNFTMGCAMLLTGSYKIFLIGSFNELQPYILLWLGISLLSNCAPSFEDMLALKDYLYGGKNIFAKVILSPFFAVVCLSACLEKYSLTFVASIVFSLYFPNLFNLIFPLIENIRQMLA